MRIVNINSLAVNIFDDLLNHEVLLFYYGELDFQITNQIILNTQKRLKEKNISKTNYNIIYSACVEGVENAYKHQKQDGGKHIGLFLMSLHRNSLIISIGNPIEHSKRVQLSERIEHLLQMPEVELKKLIKNKISNADVEKDESASVGLMKIILGTKFKTKAIFKEYGSNELLYILEMKIELS